MAKKQYKKFYVPTKSRNPKQVDAIYNERRVDPSKRVEDPLKLRSNKGAS